MAEKKSNVSTVLKNVENGEKKMTYSVFEKKLERNSVVFQKKSDTFFS